MCYEFDDVIITQGGLKAEAISEEMIVPDYILVGGDNWSTRIDNGEFVYLLDKDTRSMVSGVVTELYEDGGISIDDEYHNIEAYTVLMKVKG